MLVKKQWFTRGICAGIAILLLINGVLTADRKKSKTGPKPEFEIRNIEGWTVYINKKDLA